MSGFDDEARDAVMRIAQRAINFDHSQRYEEAIHFYVDAANQLLDLLKQKKVLPILRRQAEDYIERAEFLKRELPRLTENRRASKSSEQLSLERAEFAMCRALDCDERGDIETAMRLYGEAIETCLEASRTCSNLLTREKLRAVASKALERAEAIKSTAPSSSTCPAPPVVQQPSIDIDAMLPDVPVDELSQLHLDPSGGGSGPATPSGRSPNRSPATPRKGTGAVGGGSGGLTREEIAVLLVTSKINGRDYVPFMDVDLKEKFSFPVPFTDRDGKLALAEKQRARLKGWARPDEVMEEPCLIRNIDSGTIKQTVISDCSFVASLAIAARYERRFGKQLVTSIIYPQNRAGVPVHNPSGKYMVKLHINGVWRKVIIDDLLPVGDAGRLLCSYSQQAGELWVSLLEKAYMKVMGGYDFPGSNSNIDLHALTGWIPERIAIRKDSKDFDADKVFNKLLSRFHQGDCLITLATGKMEQKEADRAGLVDAHAYAVLDLRRVGVKRLLMLKNPWTHLRWKGRFSEKDTASWTPDMRKALDYDPSTAAEKDDGVFWIDYESVCHFFDVFYVNWNPQLFPHTYGLHASWSAGVGPSRDVYSVAANPQYRLVVKRDGSAPAAVWILLTRHITEIADFADNKEYITVMVYRGGKKVYIPFDPKPLYDAARINSPHFLCQMVVTEPGPQNYTLVVAQYEKMNTIHYTLRVYSSVPISLAPIKTPYKEKKTETSKWEGKTAGGCGNGTSRETVANNPIYHVTLDDYSDDNHVLIDLKGPKQYSVGFEVTLVSSPRPHEFAKKDSGTFRPGYCVLALESIPAGVYAVRPMTFLAGQEGPFILKVESSCKFGLKRVQ